MSNLFLTDVFHHYIDYTTSTHLAYIWHSLTTWCYLYFGQRIQRSLTFSYFRFANNVIETIVNTTWITLRSVSWIRLRQEVSKNAKSQPSFYLHEKDKNVYLTISSYILLKSQKHLTFDPATTLYDSIILNLPELITRAAHHTRRVSYERAVCAGPYIGRTLGN